MQLAIVIVFAVTCALLAFSSFDRDPIIKATAQLGFVSIDCGGDTNYTDPKTGINWASDSRGFGLENVSRVASAGLPEAYSTWTWISSMRIFEAGKQSKYCYVFDESDGITVTNPYLVRATFWTGDKLPGLSMPPNKARISFKLLINADEWDSIDISLPQTKPLLKEVYVLANLPQISVCVGGDSDPAFISALVLRPIQNNWASVNQFVQSQNNNNPKLMFLHSRLDYGSSNGDYVRYPKDVFDRIWTANTEGPSISTARFINTTFNEKPPSAVLQTARTQNSSFNITFAGFSRRYDFYFDLYFAEVSDVVTAPLQRVFNGYTITGSNVTMFQSNIDPFNNTDHVAAYYSRSLVPVDEGGSLIFNFEKPSTSLFGPLLSALELRYSSTGPMSSGTSDQDVLTLERIKTSLQGFNSWRGDPCLPIPYEWLTCDSEIRPRITKLSLRDKALTAEIPVEIGSLLALDEIDLRGNNLHGSIPDSIAKLPNLKTLLLQDNNLSGPIPQVLLRKKLNFSVAGNLLLCKDSSEIYCDYQHMRSNVESKRPFVAIVVSISVVAVVLLVLASIFVFYFRRKGKIDHVNAITQEEVVKYSQLAQHFTSQQIERMTDCFKTKLGAGGFGDVFFGTLSTGLNVAVKVSSHRNGAQEGSEFLNEVALLSRVHHKNLVEFVGYCIRPRLVLVYEYMPKGSLDDYLHGNVLVPSSWRDRLKIVVGAAQGNVLVPSSWRDRLKIVVGAAQGLEYLHKGCKPPIIHRDVKCSNILLDEGLEGRISDFGISRTKSANTQMIVTDLVGTVGYIAPESAELRITEKIDVFAFGVVLFEVVSGRRAIEGLEHIVNWVKPLLNRSEIEKIVDPRIVANYNMSSMWKVLEVAMACVEEDREKRPDMHDVASELNLALSFEMENEEIVSSYDSSDLPFDGLNVLAR